MGAHVIKVLVPALSLFAGQAVAGAASCSYPDEGNMPLVNLVGRIKVSSVTALARW